MDTTHPPDEMMAAFTRGLLEEHDEWDMLHQFIILGWDGKEIIHDTLAGIDPSIEPALYPKILRGLAEKQIKEHPQVLPYAYALQIEAWMSKNPIPGLPPSKQPDRVEIALAVCNDIDGRSWAYAKRRDTGAIEDYSQDGMTTGGRFANALRGLAVRARDLRAAHP